MQMSLVITADVYLCVGVRRGGGQVILLVAYMYVFNPTESGSIYTFGANGEGQLGVEDISDSHTPVCVDTLDRAAWRMLAAGCDHSVALTGQYHID